MPLACLLVCDTQIYEWTDKLTMDQEDARAKNKKKSKQQKVAKIIFSEAQTSEQEMLRHHSAALERQYDHKIQ